MTRCFLLTFLAVLVIGCQSPLVEAPANLPDYRASAAAVLTSAVGETVDPVVPEPPPAGVCANCGGKGRLGDGTVSVPCPVCGGDGRTDNEPPPEPVEPEQPSTPPQAAPAPQQDAYRVQEAPRRRGLLRRVLGR